jgi:hypothetical protein
MADMCVNFITITGDDLTKIREELKKAPERYERNEILRMRLGDASKQAWRNTQETGSANP